MYDIHRRVFKNILYIFSLELFLVEILRHFNLMSKNKNTANVNNHENLTDIR